MQLDDLNLLLGITIPVDQEPVYEARLEAAIEQAKIYCNRDFLDADGFLAIPRGAQIGIALMVKSMGETQNVQSQSLGDMAKSFFEGATNRAAINYLKPYRRMSFK